MLTHLRSAAEIPGRVVLLGGGGFIGRHLARQLAASGVAAVSVGSRDIDLAGSTAPAALASLLEPGDVVVLLACATPERGDDPATLVRNIAIADHAGRALAKRGSAQIIHLGSDAVYPDDGMIADATAPSPASLYGHAHLVREEILAHAAASRGIPFVRLRVCAVYGPGDTHHAYGPNRFARMALAAGRIELFGDGEDERDHIHVDDVCGIVAACAAWRSDGAVNVATGRAHTFADVARRVAHASGVPVEIVSRPRLRPVTRRRHDITALRQAFPGLSPLTLDEGLRRMMRRAAFAS